jgi:hypothetical protein
VAVALVLLGVAAATSNRFDNGLVWDDIYVIEQGEVIHDWGNLPDVLTHRTMYVSVDAGKLPESNVDTWRPVTLVTFMIDASLTGRDPLAYHITNYVGHLLCVLLVFFVARRVLAERHRWLAPFSAAFFGLNPLLAEAHVWIDGRSDVFCTLFGLGAVLAWDAGRAERGPKRPVLYAASAFLFLLGLGSKEVLLLAVPALVMWPVWASGETWRARLLSCAGFFVVALVYLGLRSAVLEGLRTHGSTEQLGHAALRLGALVLDGVTSLVVPNRVTIRSMIDDYGALGPWGLLGLLVAVAAIGIALVRLRRRAPVVVWGLSWFALTLAPAAIIATVLWLGFGRYLYLPAVGLGIALAAAVGHAVDARPSAKRGVIAVLSVYALALALRLHLHTYDWHDELTLYESVIEALPEQAHGYGWMGMTLAEHGEHERAIAYLSRAERMAPHRPRYLVHLGYALARAGDTQAALNVVATGIGRHAPAAGDFHELAAVILGDARPDLVSGHLVQCLEDEPDHPQCRASVSRLARGPRGAEYAAHFEARLSTESSALRALFTELM